MLKPLLLALTTLLPLTFGSINTAQTAHAVTRITPSQGSPQQLMAKGDKSSHTTAQQQSDVKNIHQTLTQFYRGINEYDVESMSRAVVMSSASEKAYMQRLFNRLKSYHVDMSVEVQNIDLLKLSDRNAMVKINLAMKSRTSKKAVNSQQSSILALVKYQGKWKISDADTVMKSIDRDR